MEATINNVTLAGKLVKVGLEVKKLGQLDEAIAGDVVIRTLDGSEHEVNYFAYKFKKDKEDKTGKKFTSEENGMYKGYETAIAEFKSLEKYPEEVDIVKIGFGEIGVQDYVNKQDQTLKSYNDIKARFINRLELKDIETTPQTATFEVEGIITKLTQELKKEVPTGNEEVHLDVLGYQGAITPVRLIVPENMVDAFGAAGFYEGGLAKFTGIILNTKTVETVVESQAFGKDNIKQVTTTVKRLEVTGGSPKGTIYDVKDGSDEAYEAAKSKRRLKLQEIKNKAQNQGQNAQEGQVANSTPQTPFGSNNNAAPGQTPAPNPFTKNPFTK